MDIRGQFCVIEGGVRSGEDVTVWNYVHIRTGVYLGSHVSVGDCVHIGPNVYVGNGTRIGNSAQIHEPTVIGHRCFIGPNVFVGNDRYPNLGGEFVPQPVTIGDDAVIGAGAMLMGGVKVGRGAVVGMGSVVVCDVLPLEVVAGNPAKVIGRRNVHQPGTAVEHLEPLGEGEGCHVCQKLNLVVRL